MLAMDMVNDIRFRFYVKGEKISKIKDDMKLDWKTVQKYIDMKDFNEPPPKAASKKRFCPKLDPYKAQIDEWLVEDKQAPWKQRHTATKVFKRLQREVKGFNCSYRTVAAYYAVKHKEIFSGAKEGFLPLVHRPGEAQVDFGTADFYENGSRLTGKHLEVSFLYSNKGYLQLFYGENMECLLEGLDAIFRYISVVPAEVWFDNMKPIVTKVIRGGGRETTERFERFREHYRFQAVFMNPGAGYEKGNVENKVGYQRRNFLVPLPRFLSLADFNQQLLQMCKEDADREHYRHNETIEERFQEDLKHCHRLPEVEFDLGGKGHATTNNWGKFYLYKGMHEYSVSPKYANTVVNLHLTSSLVIVMDENYREIIRHRRLYGDTKQQSMEWLPYLRQLSLRPRALKYSGIYDMMPSTMKQFLTGCSNTETGVLEVVLIFTNGMVLPLMSEFLENTPELETIENDGVWKQDCELKAFYRLIKRLKTTFPKLPITLLLDGLYANGPVMEVCHRNKWHFMIVLKDGSLPSVWQEVNGLLRLDSQGEYRHTQKWQGRKQIFNWVNEIEYSYSVGARKKKMLIHIVTCDESWEVTDKTGCAVIKTSRYAWLSSHPISRKNVHELCNLGARKRWLHENNILKEKHQGYHYGHIFSYDWNAMRGYHYLMHVARMLNEMALHSISLIEEVKKIGLQPFILKFREIMIHRQLDTKRLSRLVESPAN